MMKTSTIRQKFIEYFKNEGHSFVPRANLIPKEDKSLLFVNAGMVQFKPYFLGKTPPFTSEIEWNKFNLEYQAQACYQSKTKAIKNNHKGVFVYGPHKIPSPCGQTIYLCKGDEKPTEDEYKKTSCYQPPNTGKPKPKPDRCTGVSTSRFCSSPFFKNTYSCRCAPGGIWRR